LLREEVKSQSVWRESIVLWGFGGAVDAGLSGDRKDVFGENRGGVAVGSEIVVI
jgi:hypothetical protein